MRCRTGRRMKMGTYNVHAGHCPQGKGAYGAVGILQESVENRKVKDEMIRLLRAAGNTAYDCTCEENTTKNGCLEKIVAKCNAHKVDGDYSIHLNSGRGDGVGDGKNGGVEVIIYDLGMRAAAERIANSIAKEFGYALRKDNTSPCPGVKIDKAMYVLKHTKAPAAIIECCFVDDAKVWDAKRCAKAIVEGILNKKITEEKKMSTERHIKPGSAHLKKDCQIYDKTWKKVIMNAKKDSSITVLDYGTWGVKVKCGSTEGYIHCENVMPDIKPGDKLRAVKDVTVTIKKGTQLVSKDSGYLGNIVNGNFAIASEYLEKI